MDLSIVDWGVAGPLLGLSVIGARYLWHKFRERRSIDSAVDAGNAIHSELARAASLEGCLAAVVAVAANGGTPRPGSELRSSARYVAPPSSPLRARWRHVELTEGHYKLLEIIRRKKVHTGGVSELPEGELKDMMMAAAAAGYAAVTVERSPYIRWVAWPIWTIRRLRWWYVITLWDDAPVDEILLVERRELMRSLATSVRAAGLY